MSEVYEAACEVREAIHELRAEIKRQGDTLLDLCETSMLFRRDQIAVALLPHLVASTMQISQGNLTGMPAELTALAKMAWQLADAMEANDPECVSIGDDQGPLSAEDSGIDLDVAATYEPTDLTDRQWIETGNEIDPPQ